MNSRLPLLLVVALACGPLHAAEEKSKSEPGLLKRAANLVWPFKKKSADEVKTSEPGKAWKQLVATIGVEPTPLKLAEVRTMKVTLLVVNKGKKLAQLDFPTTQRIEVLVKEKDGKRIEQWSEDQAFANEPTLVTINPGERLEYVANVATRDLKAGVAYTVEGFFPNFDQLRAIKTITPAP